MAYATLGARSALATEDLTGTNPGGSTVVFTPALLGVSVAEFEVYKAVVETAQPGVSAKVKVGPYTFSVGSVGAGAEWDPNQPALVREGQSIVVMLSQPAAVTPKAKVTIWLRYET